LVIDLFRNFHGDFRIMVPYEKLSERVTKKEGKLFWDELAGWE
jgi:hypothetical protein